MLKTPIITLTTDFGLKDCFAGLMKGAILGINPDATVVDITHNIQRHNVFQASQVLSMSYKYFPPATIHVAVVDPGVGSNRRPLLVVTADHYFIGPDNGIFTPIFEERNSTFFKVFHITASHYFLPMSGSTFHGREIFAPVAAWLSKGLESRKLGDPIDDYKKIPFPRPIIESNRISGEVVSIDNFGNAITNMKKDDLVQSISPESTLKRKVIFKDEHLPFVTYYGENETGSLTAIINSFGHIELYTYGKSAVEKFNIKVGDPVTIELD